jgi:hypothetical protein
MVVTGVERLMSRRQIDAMIKCDEAEVVFRRRTKVPTTNGGFTLGSEVSLPPQKIRLIPFKRRMTEFIKNTELGNLPDLPYVLLGRHDLDCKRDDWFTLSGQNYCVKSEDIGEPEVKAAFQVDYYAGGAVNV